MPYIENFSKKQSIYWDWHVIYRLVQSNAKLLWFVYLWILIRNNCIFVKDFSKKINFLRISLSMNRRPEIKVLLLSELKKVHKWQMLYLKKKENQTKTEWPASYSYFFRTNQLLSNSWYGNYCESVKINHVYMYNPFQFILDFYSSFIIAYSVYVSV